MGNISQQYRRLLGLFTAIILYFVILFHLTKLYGPGNHDAERFILLEGGVYTQMFWWLQIGAGTLLPLLLLFHPRLRDSRAALLGACLLVVVGAFAQLYVLIVGGQAMPLQLFPGYQVESSFFDGSVGSYSPSLWEISLGLGGVATAFLLALLALRVLPILPERLTGDAS